MMYAARYWQCTGVDRAAKVRRVVILSKISDDPGTSHNSVPGSSNFELMDKNFESARLLRML
jgi:hypothetical protein